MPIATAVATQQLGAHPTGMRLLWAAYGVLPLVSHLRATGFIDDLGQLRHKLQATLADFRARAAEGGIDARRGAQATAVLAALLDQVVTSMPWGAEADWQSLDPRADAGSPAQRLLEVLAAQPDAGVRELIGVALALGFDRIQGTSDEKLIERARASLQSQQLPGPRAGALASAHVVHHDAFSSFLPLWVAGVAAAALLAALWVGLEWSLTLHSDRVYARMAGLGKPAAAAAAPTAAPRPRLAAALATQTAAQQLQVRDEIDRSVVQIESAQLFEAGEARLGASARELLQNVAGALKPLAGRILVIGHSDARQVRPANYESDWDWSVARAHAVRDALAAAGIDAKRLSYDGRGAVEPLLHPAAATAPDGNARIEIILLVGR